VETDVCIVGAGAAGGIMALELARRGIRVTVLEAGPRHDPGRRGEYVRRYLRHENPWQSPLPALDRHTTGGANPYLLEWRRARGVGGSTLAWEGYAFRFHATDFRLRSLHGVGQDWPLSYDDLEPYYGRAEAALGVAGVADDPWASRRSTPFPLPEFPYSHSDGLFARACGTLGVTLHHLPQARNSRPYGGRPACQACSTCHVCPTGAKATVDATHLRQAEASGHARIVPDASVLRLEVDAVGRVTAAVHAHPDRTERRLTARVFVLAAGAVENARVLLLSPSARFAAGLANGSGLVGKGFMSHPSLDVTGRVAETVHPYRIGFSTAMSRQFAVEGARAARSGFFLEFLNSAGPTPERLAVSSGLWGEALRRRVREEFGHRLGIRIYAEQLPDPRNTVTLNRNVRDHLGSPVPHITVSVGSYERRGLDEAIALSRRILTALGASQIETTALGFASHQLGTHRMGTDPGTSVVDPDLRAHEVPNLFLVGAGAFVTASSSPPTLTLAALALRAAERVAREVRPAPLTTSGDV
jgi:choline dehydrogenase-like flavoprotein